MKEWYTRQEVATLLGVSKSTVYHYAKQKKIRRIEDPHRTHMETRYYKEEVDELVRERENHKITGLRPSELAKQLNLPVTRIYKIIKENELPVEEVQIGDERKAYSISEEMVNHIKLLVEETLPSRGTLAEFYNSDEDIALYQRFLTPNHQAVRVVRNQEWEWGFYLPSNVWISFEDGVNQNGYKAAYPIHRKNQPVAGYTDFELPKHKHESYDFLDLVYQTWGIENIRLREYDTYFALSIKSGAVNLELPLPDTLTNDVIRSFIILGDVVQKDDTWELISGYRKVQVDLPITLIQTMQGVCEKQNLTMNEYVRSALEKHVKE